VTEGVVDGLEFLVVKVALKRLFLLSEGVVRVSFVLSVSMFLISPSLGVVGSMEVVGGMGSSVCVSSIVVGDCGICPGGISKEDVVTSMKSMSHSMF
jgi:hypothetical protein